MQEKQTRTAPETMLRDESSRLPQSTIKPCADDHGKYQDNGFRAGWTHGKDEYDRTGCDSRVAEDRCGGQSSSDEAENCSNGDSVIMLVSVMPN